VKIKSIWLRRIHKWVGLVIGLQFLLWAISGTAMALLDMDEVEGGPVAESSAPRQMPKSIAWPRVQQALAGQPATGLRLRSLPQGPVYQVTTKAGVHLFNATDGSPVVIDKGYANVIARSAHPEKAAVKSIAALQELPLAVRDHELPIWQVDFSDARNSSYYVSATTGEVLARRNDTWRWWDLFWMLHIMDYSERSSFNHPLIITVGFAMAWLAVTGFWLLFRTMWRHDFTWLKARQHLRRFT
jgi:uncharacterized iron-regulated membrane protein